MLTPGRYVGAAAVEEDDEPFAEKMQRLTATLRQQQEEGAKLDAAIAANLREFGYGLAHLADGAAYPAVRPEVVAGTQVVKAGDDVVERFSAASAPVLAKIATNERESRTLAALRDTLLPKLISGELRVKEVEKIAEALV